MEEQFQAGIRCVGVVGADRYQVERKCSNIRAESSRGLVQTSKVISSHDN